jgi:nicotinate-nucleotide adenylyltransferase
LTPSIWGILLWLKMSSPILAAEYRVQMVCLALSGKPYFKLSTMEIERAGPSYTIDTLAELKGQLGAEDRLFFILGWDNLAQLPQWREPARLVELCRLVAVPRVGYPAPDLDSLEAIIPGLSQAIILLDTPRIDITASVIRSRVARGLPIHHLVPEPVNEYIKQHRLYISVKK